MKGEKDSDADGGSSLKSGRKRRDEKMVTEKAKREEGRMERGSYGSIGIPGLAGNTPTNSSNRR